MLTDDQCAAIMRETDLRWDDTYNLIRAGYAAAMAERAEPPASAAVEALVSQRTGQIIGCVQHDCAECQARPAIKEVLRELLAALDNSARADSGRDDVAAMLRYADAEAAARAVLQSLGKVE